MNGLSRRLFWGARELEELLWMFDFKLFLKRHKITLERNIAGILKDGVENHYTIRPKPKKSGGYRLTWEPDRTLWAYQKMILEIILYRVAPSPVAHGGVPGRSISTCLDSMLDAKSVFHVDLKNAFESVSFSQTLGLRTDLRYEPRSAWVRGFDVRVPVMEAIIALCEIKRMTAHGWYENAFLPQGAPTSQHLFTLALYPVHRRLARLTRNRTVQYGDDFFLLSPEPSIPPKVRRAFVRTIERHGRLEINSSKTYYLTDTGTENNPVRGLGANIIRGTARLRPRHLHQLRMDMYCAIQAGDEAKIAGTRGFVSQIYRGQPWPSQLALIKPDDWDDRELGAARHSKLSLSVNIGDIFNYQIVSKTPPPDICKQIYPLDIERRKRTFETDGVALTAADQDFLGRLSEGDVEPEEPEFDSFAPPLFDAWGEHIVGENGYY
ncbi:MAG: reverse transcriptase domain-containing protein [Patescibacteria group bacterium]|jgi:hypothetical protein